MLCNLLASKIRELIIHSDFQIFEIALMTDKLSLSISMLARPRKTAVLILFTEPSLNLENRTGRRDTIGPNQDHCAHVIANHKKKNRPG